MSAGTSELEREIEASRSRLDGALFSLQGRLNIPGIVEDALGAARRNDVGGRLYDGAIEAVRRNPFPVLLICAGALMLLRGSGKKAGRYQVHRDPEIPKPRTSSGPVVPVTVRT